MPTVTIKNDTQSLVEFYAELDGQAVVSQLEPDGDTSFTFHDGEAKFIFTWNGRTVRRK